MSFQLSNPGSIARSAGAPARHLATPYGDRAPAFLTRFWPARIRFALDANSHSPVALPTATSDAGIVEPATDESIDRPGNPQRILMTVLRKRKRDPKAHRHPDG